jgi:hypothetical protein
MPFRPSSVLAEADANAPIEPLRIALTMPSRKFVVLCARDASSRSSPNGMSITAVGWVSIVVWWRACLPGCSNTDGCVSATKNVTTFTPHSYCSVACSSAGTESSGFVRTPKNGLADLGLKYIAAILPFSDMEKTRRYYAARKGFELNQIFLANPSYRQLAKKTFYTEDGDLKPVADAIIDWVCAPR